MNSSKSSTSVMLACTSDGRLLPPYVVFKAQFLYDTWCEGGPAGARYNRSKSGWFDSRCFEDWLAKIVVPWAKTTPGRKIIIGDNLSSHLSAECVFICEKNDIDFIKRIEPHRKQRIHKDDTN